MHFNIELNLKLLSIRKDSGIKEITGLKSFLILKQ